MTNNGIPNSGQGTSTAHQGYSVTLSSPNTVLYCSNSGAVSAYLYTAINLLGRPVPAGLQATVPVGHCINPALTCGMTPQSTAKDLAKEMRAVGHPGRPQ
jgi:hypothetical protein